LRKRLGQHFDRDVAFERHIAGAIDFPHASGAEKAHDLVSAYVLARLKRHLRLTQSPWAARQRVIAETT
jgi:hypothetical protein